MAYYQIANFEKYLKNPSKYKGVMPITLRSGWEIKFATWLDKNASVLNWNSETIIIKYDFLDPVKKTVRNHRYFTDFWMRIEDKNKAIKEYVIEIKPYDQTRPPAKPKRQTQAHQKRVFTYLKNQAKWAAARKFCEDQQRLGKDISFIILTEKDIPV